ncbi:MAG: phosphatase PAP2 family protein [Porticoccaceae bacterium]|jgi:undecaprenyl-diphosphatase|nr:phosphatase PAP2 family protein [Porticoccaceae bacterium]MEA3298844.1 phosphatase PAP2 family protein [Pseudomonadota bacterium]HLS97523.1 phosphatase PAP2 family protein [Porticoccaceae bacterium]
MNKTAAKSLQVLLLLHQLDVVIFHWTMKRKRLNLLARLARGMSRTADGFGYPLLALGLYLLDPVQGGRLALAMVLGFAAERPLYWILKNSLRRNRPASALPGYQSFIIPSDQFSFPSGHTSGAFLTAVLLCLFFPAVAPLALAWAALVGVSRVTLGVHFPTDIVAGAAMGSTIAWCAAGVSA